MRSVALLAVACLVACGGSSSQDSGSGNTGSDAGQTGSTGTGDAGTSDAGTSQPIPTSLAVQVQGGGFVRSSPAGIACNSSCSATFMAGDVVQLTATPNDGQQFAGWSGPCGGTGSCQVTLPENATVIANFTPLPKTFTLTVSTWAGGHVASFPFGLSCANGSCKGSFVEGTKVELTVLPFPGVQFTSWSGACSGFLPCHLTVSQDLSAAAGFAQVSLPDSCDGIAPAAVAMRELIHQPDQTSSICLPGMADSTGALSFPRISQGPNHSGTVIDFLSSNGNPREVVLTTASPRPVQQTRGLSVWGGSAAAGQVLVDNFDSTGALLAEEATLLGSNVVGGSDAVDGVILAGDFKARPADSAVRSVVKLNAGSVQAGLRWGPVALVSTGDVFGTGEDQFGNSIVVTSGAAKFGEGTISAQWFNVNGTPLTGEILLLRNFVPGANTWFETSALIGGGVLVRRMDQPSASVTHAQAMVILDTGDSTPRPAPQWMIVRPDTRLQAVRNARAYALLPYGAANVSCSQLLEVVTPFGDSCGVTNYPIAGGLCDTLPLTLGADGSVIQQLPTAMESSAESGNSCTWRWWPGALD